MSKQGCTFEPGGRYDQTRTATRITVPIRTAQEDPRATYDREWLAGYRDAVRDLGAGKARSTFGSFAATARAQGYKAAMKEAGR